MKTNLLSNYISEIDVQKWMNSDVKAKPKNKMKNNKKSFWNVKWKTAILISYALVSVRHWYWALSIMTSKNWFFLQRFTPDKWLSENVIGVRCQSSLNFTHNQRMINLLILHTCQSIDPSFCRTIYRRTHIQLTRIFVQLNFSICTHFWSSHWFIVICYVFIRFTSS